jgi:hypothetical protein
VTCYATQTGECFLTPVLPREFCKRFSLPLICMAPPAIGTPGLNLNTLGATVRDEVHEIVRSADHEQTLAVYDKLIGSMRVYFAGSRCHRTADVAAQRNADLPASP